MKPNMQDCTVIGIDTAKSSFAIHGADASGKPVLRKTCSRSKLLPFLEKLPRCTVVLETCGGSHHWGREIGRMGHEVKLIPPVYVKPFVKRQKNDANDAAAIVEAATRPTMRSVPVKTVEAQSRAMVFRARQLLVRQRTQLANSIRGMLVEFGVVVPKGLSNVIRLREIVEDRSREIPELARTALETLFETMTTLTSRIQTLSQEMSVWVKGSAAARRLQTIPGIGPVTSYAILTFAGEMKQFRNGREFAAWIGCTPKEHSTGGRQRIGSITKMGQRDIRTLLVNGAMSVLQQVHRRSSDRRPPNLVSPWLQRMLRSKPTKVVAVAMANRMARIAWAVLTSEADYESAKGFVG